jgi:hypothetical protein
MNRLVALLRRYRDSRKHVRPWAMAVPVLVLLFCLPLLRPLRHPDPRDISNEEMARLATVQAMVEHHTLALDLGTFAPTDHLIEANGRHYSDQPPMFAALLAVAYWGIRRLGVTFSGNPAMVAYLLTVIGTTLPAAGIAGLVYRMGRLFELPRIWRTVLAATVVFGGGIVAYATVLNEHVIAAMGVMSAAACLVHIAISRRRLGAGVWLLVAGFCAATAATMDLSAGLFLVLLIAVIFALPWPLTTRAGGLVLYLFGAMPPIFLHCLLVLPITGDWKPGILHPELATTRIVQPATDHIGDWDDEPGGFWSAVADNTARWGGTLFGSHGLLSHFPAVLLAALGVSMVMHRHWPSSTKTLAAASAIAPFVVIGALSLGAPSLLEAGYANRWFIVSLPMLMLWIGVWLRRPHRPLNWTLAGVLVAFGTLVTLIGATGPLPRTPFTGYTAADAMDRFLNPNDPPKPDQTATQKLTEISHRRGSRRE